MQGAPVITSRLQHRVFGDGITDDNTSAFTLADGNAPSALFVVTFDTAAQSPLTVNTALAITVTDGATVAIDGASAQSVTFAGSTGTLILNDAPAFTGQVLGLTGSDTLDLADVSYGATTTASFSGTASGGTLTVTDGTHTAQIALVGDYLTSGWTLSSNGHGGTDVVDPPLPGSVFPNATNTGIAAGTKLTPATSNTISSPGVYSGLIFNGTVTITSSNVTLENCLIEGTPNDGFELAVVGNLSNVVIQNDEIAGAGDSSTQTGVYGIYLENDSQVTINAVNIHDVGVGVDVSAGQVIVENSYIHNFGSGPGTHYNGVAYFGGGGSDFSLLIKNNSIINQLTQTDAVILQNYFGPINNVTVTNNLLYGGDYPIYVEGEYSGGAVTNVSITNNDLGLGPGSFGYTDFNSTNPTFTGNVDDGATLVAALPVSPVVSLASAAAGNYSTGNNLTLTLYTSEVVTVSGTPTLTLNDGGTATYTGGSGTNALTFSYTVGSSQSTNALAVTAVNGTIDDLDGNALSTSNLPATFTGVAIASNGAAPTVSAVGESPASGDLNAGKTVTFALRMSENVTVSGGTPTLTLNDGGTATYTGGSGTNALTFSYTVAAGQNTASLAATAVNLNSATITDGAGNAANLSLSGLTQTGPQIDTTTPAISSITESPSSGDVTTGNSVTLTLNMSENVTVNTSGSTPTLTLNDGETATYVSGSGTSALTFNYTVAAGDKTSALAATAVNLNGATIADGAGNAVNLSLTGLTQVGPPINTTTPTISSITESPSGGDVTTGNSVTLTLNMSENVTVNTSGGTPTLTLNDGETAAYVGGSGTSALTFSYTVANADATAALAATAVNLNGATITDGSGNAANLSVSGLTQSGPQINTPVGTWYNQSFPTQTTTFTATFDATPSQLGSDIVIGLGPAAASAYTGLAAIVRFNSSNTIDVRDGSTYSANVSVPYTAGTTYQFTMVVDVATDTYSVYVTPQGGSQIALATNYSFRTEQATDTSLSDLTEYADAGTVSVSNFAINAGPTISSLVESPSSGDLNAGKVVTLTLNLGGAVTVADGTPTLTLNDGGVATYTGGSGSSALTFSYTVGAGQNTASLAATAVNLNSAIITAGAGNAANLSLSGLTQTGPQIDTTTPVISAIGEVPTSGDLNAGKTVTYTLTMSEAVTVNTSGGSPTLALNDGGTATYVSGSGTNALTFSYTVLAGQNTPDLQVSAVNLNGATIADGAGNAANVSLTGLAQGSPQVDTTPPTVSSVTAPAGDYNAGKALTLTLNMSEAVNVSGTPTLTLNDGGTATYVSGSGSSTLLFSYTVGAGQNTTALGVTGVTGTITDLAGNTLSTAGLPETFTGVTIDTATPVISSLVESPSTGDLIAGKTVTLTLNLSEVVTVNTSGGTPTLTLNDGGTATYAGGSGSSALTFSYTVAAGQNTASLAAIAVNLNSASITDGAGNAANLSLSGLTQTGPQIDTTGPTVSSIVELPLEWGSQCRQGRDADAEPGRGSDGGWRHADADAQRRWRGDLYGRLGLERADLQLHGGGRAEHGQPGGDRRQSQFGDHYRRCRQCRQPVARWPDPDRAADRHHDAHDQRDWGSALERRPQCRQDRHLHPHPERGGDGQHHRRLTDALPE